MGPTLTLDEATAWLAEQPVTRRWSEPRRRWAASAALAAGCAAARRLSELPAPPIERLAGPHVFAGVAKYAEWDALRGVIVFYEAGIAELAVRWGQSPSAVEAHLTAHERYHALSPSHGTRAEEELAAWACAVAQWGAHPIAEVSMPACLCLTYDDALPVHRELVAPALAERGLRGTFYVPAASGDLHGELEAWRAVAAAGHELGNHSCWHPCRLRPGAAYKPAYQLQDYTRRRIADELKLANQVLTLVDGAAERSYAATCHDTTVGPDPGESFVEEMRVLFPLVRAGMTELPSTGPLPFITPAFSADRRRAADVIAAAEQMRGVEDAWLVVLMHGVGEGTHNHFIAADEHTRLIDWLAEQRDWLAGVTLCEAARRRGVLTGEQAGLAAG